MLSFWEMHRQAAPLVLPNAWDVPSALAFAAAGYQAVGTTSFGVALSDGRADGERGSREGNLALAAVLAKREFRLSVDVEDGYSDDPVEVARYLDGLEVDGINIEDSSAERLIGADRHAAKVRAVKERHPEVFVNARVDTFWLGQDATVEETLRRARAYVEAGADGIFVPGLSEPAAIKAVTGALAVPVNLLPVPGVALDELGVRRVSTGSLPYRAAIRAALDAAHAVRDGSPLPAAADYAALQEMIRRAGS